MSLDRREFQRLCCLIESTPGWRIEFTQTNGGKEKRVRTGSHVHSVVYPPDPDAKPIAMGISGDPMAKKNVWAGLRRNGIEPDPRRIQHNAAKQRRQVRGA